MQIVLHSSKIWMNAIEAVTVDVKSVLQSFLDKKLAGQPAAAGAFVRPVVKHCRVVVADGNVLDPDQYATQFVRLGTRAFLYGNVSRARLRCVHTRETIGVRCGGPCSRQGCLSNGRV